MWPVHGEMVRPLFPGSFCTRSEISPLLYVSFGPICSYEVLGAVRLGIEIQLGNLFQA
jgi:hypothetical protein